VEENHDLHNAVDSVSLMTGSSDGPNNKNRYVAKRSVGGFLKETYTVKRCLKRHEDIV